MIPQEVFKRRRNHNNTPESLLLIIANFIVFSIDMTLFENHGRVNWFFWVVLVLLAVYNFFTIRRNLEEYNKVTIMVYISSLAVLILLFFVFKGKP